MLRTDRHTDKISALYTSPASDCSMYSVILLYIIIIMLQCVVSEDSSSVVEQYLTENRRYKAIQFLPKIGELRLLHVHVATCTCTMYRCLAHTKHGMVEYLYNCLLVCLYHAMIIHIPIHVIIHFALMVLCTWV